MTTRLRWLAALLVLPMLAACSGREERFPQVVRLQERDLLPQIVNSELVVGQNRFVLGILTERGLPLVDADVQLGFYDLNSVRPVKKFELQAVPRVPAREAGLTEQIEHIHADGTRHIHVNVGDEFGVYTAQVTFDRAGDWGVEIRVRSQNPRIDRTLPVRFNVLERGSTPAIGSPAPRSRNLTVHDVQDIAEIDSSARPSADMHTTTIADAIAAGRPALVLFAVPGYCTSRLCGPVLEIMRKLYPRYRDRVEFIHVEFYKDPGSSQRTPVETVREWNLRSEPWFFLIDSRGFIAAKFEGPVSVQELEDALAAVLKGS